jgi:hypothetical protein
MIGEKETTEHGVTLVDAPLLLDEGFGLEEVSLTTLLELAELKPNADNLVIMQIRWSVLGNWVTVVSRKCTYF